MVGSVSNNVGGAAAYVKGSQLGSSPRKSEGTPKESEPVSFVREKDAVQDNKRADDAKADQSAADTLKRSSGELQTRNDDSTLDNEQTRGSLLDIAV